MPDHMLLSIPPKYAVSQVVGFIKGKSAIHMARVYGERKRNFVGTAFLGPGIFRQHGRTRRRSHSRLHPKSREGRSEAGADEPLALTSRLGRLQIQRAASATLPPLRAVHILKPPALPGDTLLTLPEATPVSEAATLQEDLRRAKIEPFGWVINKSLASTGTRDPLLRFRLIGERAQIARVHGLASADLRSGSARSADWGG